MNRMILAMAPIACLWSTSSLAEESSSMLRLGSKPQELIGAKITVSDLERSFDFYTRLVGLKPTDATGAGEARRSQADFIEISLNHSGSRRDPALVLIRRKGASPTRDTAQMTWVMFKVPDASGAIARIRSAGYEIRNDATDYAGLKFGIAYDPDGYTVEFLQTANAE